jgi:hypothetical protein
MEYVSRVPRPPLDGLIDDLYYLEGASPYSRLTLPPMPAALLIVNLGAPFRIRGGADIEAAEYADGCVVTTPTRAFEFGYPLWTRSVGAHVKPWGLRVAAGVSSTHLAHRFKELIGVTPKRLARTYRFAATVFAIDPARPIDWGDLAGGAGYFDQAHFGHEFRAFTGLTPTRYVEVRRRFLREHPGHVMDGWPLPAD